MMISLVGGYRPAQNDTALLLYENVFLLFQKQLLFDFFTCIILEGGNFDTPSQIV